MGHLPSLFEPRTFLKFIFSSFLQEILFCVFVYVFVQLMHRIAYCRSLARVAKQNSINWVA